MSKSRWELLAAFNFAWCMANAVYAVLNPSFYPFYIMIGFAYMAGIAALGRARNS